MVPTTRLVELMRLSDSRWLRSIDSRPESPSVLSERFAVSQTIAVPERLAARLEQKAQWQRTNVESLVVTILDAAVGPDDLGDDWSAKNARRVALIHQRFTQGLGKRKRSQLFDLRP